MNPLVATSNFCWCLRGFLSSGVSTCVGRNDLAPPPSVPLPYPPVGKIVPVHVAVFKARGGGEGGVARRCG